MPHFKLDVFPKMVKNTQSSANLVFPGTINIVVNLNKIFK